MYGSIELGGTTIRCAIFDENWKIIKEIRIKTEYPNKNLEKISDFFKTEKIKSIGVGAFGPIDLDKDSKNYGYILSTPKKLWRNFDLVGTLKNNLDILIKLTTDFGASGIG